MPTEKEPREMSVLTKEQLDKIRAGARMGPEPLVPALLDTIADLESRVGEEQAAHEKIADLCFKAGVSTDDGTSIGAVRGLVARVRELEGALRTLSLAAGKLHHWHDALDGGMVVSGDSVRAIWVANDIVRAALANNATPPICNCPQLNGPNADQHEMECPAYRAAPVSKPDIEGLRERIRGTVSYIRLRMNDRETIDATITDATLDVLRKEGLLP